MLSENQAEELRRVLHGYIEMGDKHAFTLKNGQNYQGCAYDVEGDVLMMWDSGPMAAENALEVPIADIDLNTLSYWDDARHVWVDLPSQTHLIS